MLYFLVINCYYCSIFFLYYLWNTEILWSGNRDSSQLETNPLDVKKNTPSSKSFHLLWKTLPYLLGTRLIMLLFSSVILKNHVWLAILQLGMYIEKCNAYCLTWFFCQKLCVAASRSWLGPRNSSVKLQTCFQMVPAPKPMQWMDESDWVRGGRCGTFP